MRTSIMGKAGEKLRKTSLEDPELLLLRLEKLTTREARRSLRFGAHPVRDATASEDANLLNFSKVHNLLLLTDQASRYASSPNTLSYL